MIEIYYIEDDKSIAAIVKEYLEQNSYTISVFPTIALAKCALEQRSPDLVLIDWNMPDGEGDALCRWVRTKRKNLPIIFLTVRNDSGDIVAGFDSGADDYIAKPFDLTVLHSRIKALLRRAGTASEKWLHCGPISVDKNKLMVFYEGKEVAVSQTEYQILTLLLENKGKTVTRQRLLEQIWDGRGNYVNDNTLTVAMKRLREKLCQPSCLKTVRSFGYRMEDES